MKISNRFIGILIIIIFIMVFWGAYHYIFSMDLGKLIINSNTDNYKISLKSDSKILNQEKIINCPEYTCEIDDIPAIKYDYIISKEGFHNLTGEIEVKGYITPEIQNYDNEWFLVRIFKNIKSRVFYSKEKINNIIDDKKEDTILEIKLDEKIEIKEFLTKEKNPLNIYSEDNFGSGEFISTEDRINRIKNITKIKTSYEYFDLGKLGYFYLEEEDNKFILYQNDGEKDIRINTLPKLKDRNINISKIYGKNEIFIEIGEYKYIYDLSKNRYRNFYLDTMVDYIKKGSNNSNYIIKTNKGSFVYDTLEDNLEFFNLFSDFVFSVGDNLIAIINTDDKDIRVKYSIPKSKQNLIIIYDTQSKEKNILLERQKKIDKIFKENGVYFFESEGKKYSISNLK